MDPVSRIRVLPPTLADQIAAGEVVERPASVVKELCENSLDAGARHIDIDIEAGGRKLLRVVDDGGGMTSEEARLAMLRHATSKIQKADDLWGLRTFGFRGEALPSIAAVSRLTLRTRVSDAVAGFSLQFEAGVETSSGEVGMPEGTQFEIRDLFWNTPARLKFLKSEATETAAISEAVLRLSLAYPEVHFRLRANGRQLMDLPPHRDLPERVRAALARRGATLLHEAQGSEAGVVVRAFLGPPEDASTTPRSTLLFVARRFVRDRSLLHALCMGYGELLEKGRYPMAALFVEVPGEDLDINVHPQKLEVRFARPQEVYGAVRHVVGEAIAHAPWLASTSSHAYSLPPEHLAESPQSAVELPHRPIAAEPRPRSMSGTGAIRSLFETRRRDLESISSPPLSVPSLPTAQGFFSSLDYVGQVRKTFLVCETESALVIVDQHAAHERILFEKLRQAHRQKAVPQQRLLFPIPIDLTDEVAAVTSQPSVPQALAELGFEIELFGLRTLLLRSVPELLKNADPKPLLLDVLAGWLGEESAHLTEASYDKLFATMACHAALRGGDPILPEQARTLLNQLDGVDLRSHCPHGRPVLLNFPWSEIESRLGRT
jgi:DNA mismatch repair protein MutL